MKIKMKKQKQKSKTRIFQKKIKTKKPKKVNYERQNTRGKIVVYKFINFYVDFLSF